MVNDFVLGSTVVLPRQTEFLTTAGLATYGHLWGSRYVCVREVADGHPGVLVKVLGRYSSADIRIVHGEPFCKDDCEEGFSRNLYYSYRFPRAAELNMVLPIIRNSDVMLEAFRQAKMPIDCDGGFWVRDTSRNLLGMRRLCYFDAQSGAVSLSHGSHSRYSRITVCYFDEAHNVIAATPAP